MKAPHQCKGITKSGKRCSITSKSDMRDNGRLVCDPLLNGGHYCLYHTAIFNNFHVKADDAIVAYVDFETTGLDVMVHNIVEIGLASGTFELCNFQHCSLPSDILWYICLGTADCGHCDEHG